MIIVAGIFEVILWIIGIFVVLGAITGVLAFFGLRKLWRFVSGSSEESGRPGPGNPPLGRRSSATNSRSFDEISSPGGR